METKIIPVNDFILVERITETETDNNFIITDEAKGDGIILRCRLLSPAYCKDILDSLKPGQIIYVPEYALRQISGDIMSCSATSVIAYESDE